MKDAILKNYGDEVLEMIEMGGDDSLYTIEEVYDEDGTVLDVYVSIDGVKLSRNEMFDYDIDAEIILNEFDTSILQDADKATFNVWKECVKAIDATTPTCEAVKRTLKMIQEEYFPSKTELKIERFKRCVNGASSVDVFLLIIPKPTE